MLTVKWSNRCRGVSHTPSTAGKMHIKRWCHVGCYHFISAHIRAYAIRPYTCSIDFRDLLGCVMISFPPTSGRMRYAPTPVRLLSWMNTVNIYTCSIDFWVLLVCVLFPFSLIWGRMRYAPTLVRLKSELCWMTNLFGGLQWDDECANALGP